MKALDKSMSSFRIIYYLETNRKLLEEPMITLMVAKTIAILLHSKNQPLVVHLKWQVVLLESLLVLDHKLVYHNKDSLHSTILSRLLKCQRLMSTKQKLAHHYYYNQRPNIIRNRSQEISMIKLNKV